MGGCEQYRVRIPYEQIRERVDGAVLDWAPIGKVREWAGGKYGLKTRPTDYDMWVLARHRPLPYGVDGSITFDKIPEAMRQQVQELTGVELGGRAHLLDMLRLAKTKQHIVLEYDDDHWGSRDLGYSEYVDLARELLELADAITVTTPYMRDLVQSIAPGVRTYILPNCVNFAEWQGWERWKRWDDDWIVLGLTGSVTHSEDWIVLKDVLPRIMAEYGNVALLLQGFIPDYLGELPIKYPQRVYADKDFRDYKEYPGVVRQADIVLCPVDPEDRFNWAKSSIKAVEGMACGRELSTGKVGGSAIIASPLDYYKKVMGHGKRGIIAEHTPEGWYEAIKALVTKQEQRERYQVLGRRWVWKNRAIERQWHLWWNAYDEIYRRIRK